MTVLLIDRTKRQDFPACAWQAVPHSVPPPFCLLTLSHWKWTEKGQNPGKNTQKIMATIRMSVKLYLFDPLQQWRQPIFVDLTVTVQKRQDPGSCSIRSSNPGSDQSCGTYTHTHTNTEWVIRGTGEFAFHQSNTLHLLKSLLNWKILSSQQSHSQKKIWEEPIKSD